MWPVMAIGIMLKVFNSQIQERLTFGHSMNCSYAFNKMLVLKRWKRTSATGRLSDKNSADRWCIEVTMPIDDCVKEGATCSNA